MANFNEAIEFLLAHEGKLANNIHDPGGITNFGISLRFLKATGKLSYDFNKDGQIDANDIRCMTKQEAEEIYKTEWWDKYQYERINADDIATKLLDMSVNMGQHEAVKLMQQACVRITENSHLICDGVMGPTTINVINNLDANRLLPCMRSECAHFYTDLVEEHPDFKEFEQGWMRRAYS